jgi:transcription initiation factor TFIID subunit 2
LFKAAPTPDAFTPNTAALSKEPEFEPIVLFIEYELRHPREGLQFVGLSENESERIPHVYTTASSDDAARCWIPCVDSLWERCTWELEFAVPRTLAFEEDSADADIGSRRDEFPVSVVASGELLEQVVHPFNSSKIIFHYAQATPTSVQHIAFAAGPFEILDLSPSRHVENPDEDDQIFEDSSQPTVHAFCLAGRSAELSNSCSFMRKAMEFYVSEFGSYPFASYKLVFVDEMSTTTFNAAALSIISSDLLFPPNVIEQAFETRQVLSHGLASQWVGVNIIQRHWADTWLINGLSLYISGQFLRKLMGNNEYRFRIKKDILRCAALDVRMPPICQPGIPHPPPADILPFMNLKASLVLHILDRQLLRSGTSMGLSRVIPRVFLSAISGELKDNLLSTNSFLRTCKKVSGGDLRLFAEQWIYSSGCPRFSVKANFNRKKMAVEMSIVQDVPAAAYAKTASFEETAHLKPVQMFEVSLFFCS